MSPCLNQKTSPVNAHLTPDPGIYVDAFVHVHSPRAGADNPLGMKFWWQQKGLFSLPICCKFQNDLFEIWFYTHLLKVSNISLWILILYTFLMFLRMYIAPGQGQTTFVDKILMSTEKPCHFAHLLQLSKKYLWSLLSIIFYTCI